MRFEFSKKEKLEKNEKNHKISKKLNISKNFGFFLYLQKLVTFTSKICKQKLQAEIASRNCKQKLQAQTASKI